MRRLLLSTFLLGSALGTLGLAARVGSRRVLFPVSEIETLPPPAHFVRRALTASDGVPVHAIELPAPEGANTVVVFHNNRETVEHRADFARALHARGLGVLLVEYRGYGLSAGHEPSEAGLYRDADAALDMLSARGVGPQRIVLWGISLGTGVAAEMASRGRGSRLVMVAPYTSIPDLVTDTVPGIPANALLPDHFDTLSKAGAIRVPTLVVHGDADEIVPFWMGKRLERAIADAELLRIRGACHADWLSRGGGDLFDRLERFAG